MGFAECLVGLSILVPGTFFFVAFSAFAGAAQLNLAPLAARFGLRGVRVRTEYQCVDI